MKEFILLICMFVLIRLSCDIHKIAEKGIEIAPTSITHPDSIMLNGVRIR